MHVCKIPTHFSVVLTNMELAQACPIKAGSYYYLHKKISKQDVGMAQYMNALADKVLKQEVPCTQ